MQGMPGRERGPESSWVFTVKSMCLFLHIQCRETSRRRHTWACAHMILLVRGHHCTIPLSSLSAFLRHSPSWAPTVAAIWDPFPPPICPTYSCLLFDEFRVCALMPASCSLCLVAVLQPWALLPVPSTPLNCLVTLGNDFLSIISTAAWAYWYHFLLELLHELPKSKITNSSCKTTSSQEEENFNGHLLIGERRAMWGCLSLSLANNRDLYYRFQNLSLTLLTLL